MLFGMNTSRGKNGNLQSYKDRRKPVLSFAFTLRISRHITPAHSSLNIPNVQVEVNILPMIQFIQGYFALK